MSLISYFHRFIPRAAMIPAPISDLFEGAKNSPKPLEWEWGAEDAFNTIKRQLISLTRLVYPVPHAPMALSTDASVETVGGVPTGDRQYAPSHRILQQEAKTNQAVVQ